MALSGGGEECDHRRCRSDAAQSSGLCEETHECYIDGKYLVWDANDHQRLMMTCSYMLLVCGRLVNELIVFVICVVGVDSEGSFAGFLPRRDARYRAFTTGFLVGSSIYATISFTFSF
jgi:hypothetical protein